MAEKTSNKNRSKIDWVQDPNMRDYSKEVHFVEKNKKATEFLLKHGLPDQLKEKAKK